LGGERDVEIEMAGMPTIHPVVALVFGTTAVPGPTSLLARRPTVGAVSFVMGQPRRSVKSVSGIRRMADIVEGDGLRILETKRE